MASERVGADVVGSGGSIASAALAADWMDLNFDSSGVALSFDAVAARIHRIAGTTLDVSSVLGGLLPGISAAGLLARRYRRHFGSLTLQGLPDVPRFTLNTTNFASGALLRWAKEYAADYRVGTVFAPKASLADVVAASSAFPPFLSPLSLSVPGVFVNHESRAPVANAPKRLHLTDGGVYDNFGLEPLKTFHTVLVSDCGQPFN